jgi:hypothetical protein
MLRQRAISWSGLPTFDFVARTTASAASVNATAAGESGSETTIGTPSSPPARSAGTSGTYAMSGIPSVSAASRPPPSPKIVSRSPQ